MNNTRQWFRMIWTSVVVLSLVAGIVVASEPAATGREPTQQTTQLQPKLEKANELLGTRVVSRAGKRVGTVEDIVLTPERDRISYVAVAHGGLAGIGQRLFAVPWSVFEISVRNGNTVLVLDADAEHFKSATSFNKYDWPLTADTTWIGRTGSPGTSGSMAGRSVSPKAGTERSASMQSEPMRSAGAINIKYRRLSRLLGIDIANPAGDVLGELANAVVDVNSGRMVYGMVLVSSTFWGTQREVAPVPWSAIEVTSNPLTAWLDTNKETLRAIAFDANHYPDLANSQYSRDIYQRFNMTPYWEALGYVPSRLESQPGTTPSQAAGTDYEKMYNPDNMTTVHGTVESVGAFDLEGVPASGLRLRIRTDDGRSVIVYAGARSYAERHNMSFRYGDEVTIVGSPAKINEQNVILGARIEKGGQTLRLRSDEGKPLWKTDATENSR
jgi:sporulation protein YlmC with PRC-barrel domain